MEVAAEIQDLNTVKFILWLAAVVIVLLMAIVGFFLSKIVNDVNANTLEIGRNKGSIELVKQKQESDILRIEKTTQLELQTLAKQVGGLAESVQALVNLQMIKSNS
jgi:uncharacterized protein HemX